MAKNFDPSIAIDARAHSEEKYQKRAARMGKRLAKHAVREANKGHIDEPVVAKAGLRFNPLPTLIDVPEEAYDNANERLKSQGLRVEFHKPMDIRLDMHEQMTVHIVDQSSPAQEIPVRHGNPSAPQE